MGQPSYLSDSTVGTSWTWFPFGFAPQKLINIIADRANTDVIHVSDDGVHIKMRLNPGEPYAWPTTTLIGIFLKSNSGTQAYRLSAT
jgi:hypothetical protein